MSNVLPRRGLLIGAGYFSDFHLDAWRRMPHATIVAICDTDPRKASAAATKYGIDDVYTDVNEALQRTDIDFIDIATGPGGRDSLVESVLPRGLPIICQKPLANEHATARRMLDAAESSGAVFMVHDNFRFQPWYREIKRLLDGGVVGRKLHSITMRTRMGDGWGNDAYQNRQPYFRTMPRLLIHETGVHLIDVFRYLGGEIEKVWADLEQLNEVIAGEDAGFVHLTFESGATAVWDANRFNESHDAEPRYTFGQMWVEADGGSITLSPDGALTVHPLGETPRPHRYVHSREGFAGDCVLACQQHFMDVIDGNAVCETSPRQYRETLRVVEAIYESARRGCRIDVREKSSRPVRRVIDLSLPISEAMPGVNISPSKTIAKDGWNATTLQMYSHAGTHMDAPKHFSPGGDSLDGQDLTVCYGPARLVNLAGVPPRYRITVEDVTSAIGEVHAGDRLLLRTDWHRRFGTPEYRNELPRISIELGRWLVAHRVALIGVEPPSVADVNDIEALTQVHQTLFRGGVAIVEGLAHLDAIDATEFLFVALPLKIVGGDGCPVRAIAIIESEAT